jgi:hypothetical protein
MGALITRRKPPGSMNVMRGIGFKAAPRRLL